MQIEAIVRRGKDKQRCEDRCLMGRTVLCDVTGHTTIDVPYAVGVADGVGGSSLGDMASGYLCQRIAETDISSFPTAESVREYLNARNEELIRMAHGVSGAENMATTYTGVFLTRQNGWLVNAGNGRVYTMEGSRLHQLTHDHTLYAMYMSQGREAEARKSKKPELTCCFGNANPAHLQQLEIIPLYDFTVLLITSDGIHEFLTTEQMEEIINHVPTPDGLCRRLCDLAEKLGSADDMSVALIY